MRKYGGLALALLLALVPSAFAQSSGNVYGTVTDESGAVLPGVNVTLEGDAGSRSTVSSPQGAFRFLNLTNGSYKVIAGLSGFATVTRTVQVTTGENIDLAVKLKVSSVEETVEVTGETPLVDTKKRGTATTMTTAELQEVPNARDPWGVLRNVAGVLLDRVNIAGNENGQQAAAAGKGTASDDKTFSLDGVNVTDMSATGASPTYFDFDAFQEISVSTGGADVSQSGLGIGISLVTKRGTNKFRGGARYLYSGEDTSFGNVPDEMANDSRLRGNDKADHINKIADYGFDLGGPIMKDKLWFYFTYGKQDIKLKRLTQTPDDTILKSFNGKLNWQASSNTMVSAFWFNGMKQKFGRSPGSGLNEADSFLWNQDNAYEDKVGGPNRPPGLVKLAIDHTFSPNFFMSAKGAYYNTGFTLTPRGGLGDAPTYDYVKGEAVYSSYDYTAVRPQWHANLDGNYFFEGMGGNNELKFGFAYRDMTTTSITAYGGSGVAGYINSPTDSEALVFRNNFVVYGGKYTALYAGDTLTRDRMTVNVGLRWDMQSARNKPSEAPANAMFPNLLPALSYAGDSEDLISFSDLSPRIGFSYALDEARKTVLRGSYGSYTDQLSFGNVNTENPVAASGLAYGWRDANGDRKVQAGEVNFSDFRYSFNVDPANPAKVGSTVSKIDRDLKARRDHEVVLGLDREVGSNFAVGFAYTWRKGTNWDYTPRLGGACTGEPTAATCRIIQPNEYVQNAPVTRNGYTSFTYSPPAALVSAGSGGRIRTNAPGYSTDFSGVELTFVKRLSNKWMARGAFSWQQWTENWDGTPYSIINDDGNPTRTETDPLENGGPYSLLSGGSGKASFYTVVPWQVYMNGLYQLPYGIDISGALFARKGGIYPVSVRISGGGDGTNAALATESIDSMTFDTLMNLDLRLAKTFKMKATSLTLSAEWFNVMNSGTVLSRARYADSTATFIAPTQGSVSGQGRIEEILSPSIFRLGARLSF